MALRPSKNSIKRVVVQIRALTDRARCRQETTKPVETVNRVLCGWANYVKIGSGSKAYRALDNYRRRRCSRWLRAKYRVRRRRGGTYPWLVEPDEDQPISIA